MKNLLNSKGNISGNILAFFDGTDFGEIESALDSLLKGAFNTLIWIATALTALWGIYLGLKYWFSAGDGEKRKKAKDSVVSFFVGIVIIFGVVVIAPLLIAALKDWATI